MDEIIKKVKTVGRGYRMGEQEIKILCYADDAVIISEDEDNLQRMLFMFETTAKEFNMIISVVFNMIFSKNPGVADLQGRYITKI